MFAKRISSLELCEYGKIGYTLKTLGAGFWALRQDDFEKALTTIVMEVSSGMFYLSYIYHYHTIVFATSD